MAHLALYREFRPQRFSEVVGQQHIVRTLRNALVQQRVHHAYLLSGPRGTGKTTVARLLAKAVNCQDPQQGEPCNSCSSCQSIMSGETMDIIEIDAASNRGIDEIRDLRDKVKYAPADLKRKVYIIDEVHMLSEPAFNALLKTLEEPPSHVMFVLATTEKQKLPVTIISRCQSFDYHRLSSQEIVDQLSRVCLAHNIQAAVPALSAIARQADGGMRDALSLLDQVMAYGIEGQITLDDTLRVLGSAPLDQLLKMDGHLTAGNVGKALLLLDELIREGKDLRQFVRDYLGHMRDLLLLKVDSGQSILDLPNHSLSIIQVQASGMRQDQLLSAIRIFSQLENDMRFSASPRLLLEVGLIRVAAVYMDQAETAIQASVRPQPNKQTTGVAEPSATTDQVITSAQPLEDAPPANQNREQPVQVVPADQRTAAVMESWGHILELVKRARVSTHYLLAQAKVGSVRGNTVYLVVPAAFVDLLKRPADKGIIEKAFAKIGMEGLELAPVDPDHPLAKPDQPESKSVTPAEQPKGERSLLEMAKNIFPKELVHEVEEGGS